MSRDPGIRTLFRVSRDVGQPVQRLPRASPLNGGPGDPSSLVTSGRPRRPQDVGGLRQEVGGVVPKSPVSVTGRGRRGLRLFLEKSYDPHLP